MQELHSKNDVMSKKATSLGGLLVSVALMWGLCGTYVGLTWDLRGTGQGRFESVTQWTLNPGFVPNVTAGLERVLQGIGLCGVLLSLDDPPA